VSHANAHGVGDPADGDGLRAGGVVVDDPTGAGELLVGVGEGLGVCDGLGDRAGRGEVRVGLCVGAGGEEVPAGWLAPAGAAADTGRTSM
jgi:hypothetical protein